MGSHSERMFTDSEAKRASVPLLVGLVGPSGSGKTKSALRLGAGMQRVVGGELFVIDTEASRALHYADEHKFRHVPFAAPFDPLSYLAAVDHCVKKGAKVVVIDSASHMHEGPGGTLEAHDAETTRLSEQWRQSRDKVQMAAWQKPKADLQRFVNSILQLQVNLILAFRAKEKIKVIPGKPPQALGFMPISGDSLIYELTLSMLLYPNSRGIPTWHTDEVGERGIVKLPGQFEAIFKDKPQLSEDIGEKLAKWAQGGSPAAPLPHFRAQAVDNPAFEWKPRLREALAGLKLGLAEADKRELKGEDRKKFVLGQVLLYASWCAGREINAIDELTAEEAALTIQRAEAGDLP